MKAFCISHKKDVDGLGSGAMAVAATGGKIILSDYDDFVDNLKRIPDDADRLVISDIGADSADFEKYLAQMKRIARHADVTHIDHHYMSEAAKKQVRRAGVRLVHDTKECASMLTYRTFEATLPEGARLVALCGAVTDYMDDSPWGRSSWSRGTGTSSSWRPRSSLSPSDVGATRKGSPRWWWGSSRL